MKVLVVGLGTYWLIVQDKKPLLTPYESAFLGILPIREPAGEQKEAGVGVRFVYPDSPAANSAT